MRVLFTTSLLFFGAAWADIGAEMIPAETLTTAEQWTCIKNTSTDSSEQLKWIAVRAMTTGEFEKDAPQQMQSALDAGFTDVDAILIPNADGSGNGGFEQAYDADY